MEDGLYVRRFPDGSGSVSTTQSVLGDRWAIDCSVDAMSDKRECQISSKIGGPFIYYGADANPRSICIMGHDFPGRRGMIRVDSHAPVETDTDGCVAASRILPQMLTGTSVTTRRYEWPYDYTRDETTALAGFSKTIEVIARIRSGQ